MTRSFVIRPAAEADVDCVRKSLNAATGGRGDQFVSEVAKVFDRIERTPEIHGVVHKDVRATRVARFNYVVYYVTSPMLTEVIAVMHGSRDESAWRLRL